jgi:hypothetical protein
VRSGTEVLYWDDWSGRQARYTKASLTMMSITQTTDDWVITLPDAVYASAYGNYPVYAGYPLDPLGIAPAPNDLAAAGAARSL